MFDLIRRDDGDDDADAPLTLHDLLHMLQFGSLTLPEWIALNHVLLVATTGGGKTTLLRVLMQSCFFGIGTGCDRRALVIDAKRDMVSALAAMAPRADIVLMHPFDERGCCWKVWEDINSPARANDFSFTLVPELPVSQPFFRNAVRTLIYSVIMSFWLSGVEWTLADLLRVLDNRQLLIATLQKYDETREVIPEFFGNDATAANIMSEKRTLLMPYEPVVSAWEHARRQVSIEEWFRSEMILVLGMSHTARMPLQVLNRCVIKRAGARTLDAPDSQTRRNYFVIDELLAQGKIDVLLDLTTNGRSKGSCVFAGAQSVDGLKDPELYGNFREDILAQFGTKFIGRLESPESADWASRLVGDHQVTQVTHSQTTSSSHGEASLNNSTSSTTASVLVDRRAILPSQFMSFPPCNYANGLTGLFFVPSIGVVPDVIPGPVLFDELLLPSDQTVADFIPRPDECQRLRPWTPQRAAEFGIQEPTRQPQQPPTLSAKDREKLRDLDSLFR